MVNKLLRRPCFWCRFTSHDDKNDLGSDLDTGSLWQMKVGKRQDTPNQKLWLYIYI